MKISKSELVKIIQEEAQKVKKEFLLRRELKSIDDELQSLNEMVRPGGEMDPGTGGVHDGQKKPVYDGKPGFPNLKMETDDETDDITAGIEDASAGDDVVVSPGAGGEMSAVDAGASAEGPVGDMGMESDTINKDEVLNAIKDLGARLNLTGVVDFDATPEGTGDGDLGVDIETGAEDTADDLGGGSEDGGISAVGAEPTGDGTSSEEEPSMDEKQQAPAQEKDCNTSMQETEQAQKLQEEKNRWAKLAGILKS